MTTFDLSISRIFRCDAKTLFQAIGEGMLFKYTGTVMDKTKIDFREGGKFHLEWKGHGELDGEFKTIDPYSKIVFSWPTLGKDTNQKISTLVTITIQENHGKSILTLKHEGFDGFTSLNEHDWGWDDALGDLNKKYFRDHYAKREKNDTGLDLHFKIKKTIQAPRAKVFAAVAEHKQMNQYFGANAVADFVQGTKVQWNFHNGKHTPVLDVLKVIPGEMIAFQWNETVAVCIAFRDKAASETEVVIESAGYAPTQAGLDLSYRECEGWQNFLDQLAYYVQGRL